LGLIDMLVPLSVQMLRLSCKSKRFRQHNHCNRG